MIQNRQQQCCILGLCCGRVAQQDALADELGHEGIVEAEKVAAWILERFDLAPAGTLRPFGEAIVAMMRANGRDDE